MNCGITDNKTDDHESLHHPLVASCSKLPGALRTYHFIQILTHRTVFAAFTPLMKKNKYEPNNLIKVQLDNIHMILLLN